MGHEQAGSWLYGLGSSASVCPHGAKVWWEPDLDAAFPRSCERPSDTRLPTGKETCSQEGLSQATLGPLLCCSCFGKFSLHQSQAWSIFSVDALEYRAAQSKQGMAHRSADTGQQLISNLPCRTGHLQKDQGQASGPALENRCSPEILQWSQKPSPDHIAALRLGPPQRPLFPIDPEARSPRSRCLQGWLLSRLGNCRLPRGSLGPPPCACVHKDLGQED